MNKIEAWASLSVGTLYRHHKSKDDLLFAVFLDNTRNWYGQFICASDFPIFNISETRAVMDSYDFTEVELEKIFHSNAVTVFDLE